jgi:hypothetical protein
MALFAVGLLLFRGSRGCARAWLAGALLVAAGADYKAFGTSKQFNARPGDLDATKFSQPIEGLDTIVYRKLVAHPDYRVAVDPLTGPFTPEMRHHGLSTPQGFDPMISTRYREKVKTLMEPHELRLLALDPSNVDLLRSFGVRFVFTSEGGRLYPALRSNPHYSLLEPSASYFKVFELRDPQPAYRWEQTHVSAASIERIVWTPERREFLVKSSTSGRFILVEQFFPGWSATLDGRPVEIERAEDVFQAVQMPAGEHRIRFEYRPRAVLVGAAVSLLSLAGLCAAARRRA